MLQKQGPSNTLKYLIKDVRKVSVVWMSFNKNYYQGWKLLIILQSNLTCWYIVIKKIDWVHGQGHSEV